MPWMHTRGLQSLILLMFTSRHVWLFSRANLLQQVCRHKLALRCRKMSTLRPISQVQLAAVHQVHNGARLLLLQLSLAGHQCLP